MFSPFSLDIINTPLDLVLKISSFRIFLISKVDSSGGKVGSGAEIAGIGSGVIGTAGTSGFAGSAGSTSGSGFLSFSSLNS